LKANPSFREKYEYITVDYFEHLNKNEYVLHLISLYSLTSPIISLMTPFIMLIIPFFILSVRGLSISFSTYVTQLKKVFTMLPLGKLFQFGSASWDQRGFILFSVILYLVQIYQNTLTCYRFYKNSGKMVKELHEIADYCDNTVKTMEQFSKATSEYKSYEPFNEILQNKVKQLNNVSNEFRSIREGAFKNMGQRMRAYYNLFCDKELHQLMDYTFSFHEYIMNIGCFTILGESKQLKGCQFSKSKISLKNCYHPLLRFENPIKNSICLNKSNMILSGPNASGKTTLIKTLMINVFLTQQVGMGFYEKAQITPHDYLHCYINIPDTSDRDSLFQAEARRCKEILASVEINKQAKHLCVFDELFSGTNPYEAVASATGYLRYLNSHTNVRYMLTTHYIELCKKFPEQNFTFEKKYSLSPGITKIRGGIRVLEELEFPESIITTAKDLVSLN
jgi:DNA mismatch repair ATPase MutS